MVKAYVLIEARAGASRNLLRNLGDKQSVISASRVTGPYDVIAVVQEDGLEQVHEFVTEHIHSMQGVLRTTTMVAVG